MGIALFAVAAASHGLGPRYRTIPRGDQAAAAAGRTPAISPWALPSVRTAVATMVVCLTVMLLVMTVTPVHVRGAGHGVGIVGAIMSAHTFGMFALAPLAGWLTGRFGSIPVILTGLGVLVLATVTAATSPPASQPLLGVALFALGFGWCLGFVAASALLTTGLEPAARVQLQGRVEAITWITGSVAAAGSGLLLGLVGFAGLNLLAGGLVVVPAAVIAVHRDGLPRYRAARA